MTAFEKYFANSFEIVEVLKSDEKNFVALVYDKNSKKLCVMKKRNLNSAKLYKTLKTLRNTHIPEIYRLFERDGFLTVIEEQIDGQTLEDLLNYKIRDFDEDFVENIFLQVCDCLAAVHSKNIIHRDLTLSNIMLTKNNLVKVIDFGIARIYNPEKISDTEFLGTRGYAAPEQYGLFDLEQSDFRTDIFVLAMSMKNLLGENYHGRLEKILKRCTNLNPDLRYQNVSELVHGIKQNKKIWRVKKFSLIFATISAVLLLPKSTSFENPPHIEVEEKVVPAIEENISASQSDLNAELTDKLIDFMKNQQQKILEPVPSQQQKVSEPVPSPVEKIEQKTFAKRPKIYFYLNGELTKNFGEHTTAGEILLQNYQTWQRNEHGDFLFPQNWTARVKIENFTEKDLISPHIEVEVCDEKILFDKPTIKSGQTIEFDIPIANKIALKFLGVDNFYGNIYVSLKSPSHDKIPILVRRIEI